MRKPTSLVLAALLCTAVWLIPFADAQDTPLRTATATSAADLTVVSKHFPERYAVQILCWSVHDEKTGPVSQIVVLQTDREGVAQALWQSPLDDSYSPKIQFLLGVALGGLPVALVERQTGAASSVLDVIGRFKGRIQRLQRFDGSDFDLRPLDGADRPSLIVHTDVNILDVPEIYRWVGARFIIDSAAHPDFYRQLLAEDRKTLPSDTAAIVLVNLARIAALADDRAAASQILDHALSAERIRRRRNAPAHWSGTAHTRGAGETCWAIAQNDTTR